MASCAIAGFNQSNDIKLNTIDITVFIIINSLNFIKMVVAKRRFKIQLVWMKPGR
jgi:hypothetical protein